LIQRVLAGLSLAALAATAQPVVSAALNAASYTRPGLPNGGLARGSLIAIFGSNIGPPVPPSGIAITGYPLQTTFNGVSARLGGRDLFIVYGAPGQVGAIVPSDMPLGTQPLTVTYGGATSAPLNVQVVARAFGVFTANQAGSGPAAGLKFVSQSDPPIATTLFEAMNPGGVLTLFGTGFGASNNPDNVMATNLAIPGLSASDIQVTIGGKVAPIQFFGRSPCCASIDQINVQIPPDVPTGCYVPMVVTVAGVTANVSTISVAPPGKKICSDPNGYSEELLSRALAGGGIRQGILNANKISTEGPGQPASISDSVSASFTRYTVQDLIAASGDAGQIVTGACTVFTFAGVGGTADDPVRVRLTELDAGPSLSVRNSNGPKTIDKVQGSKGYYSKTILPLPAGLPPGFLPPPTIEYGPEYLTIGDHVYTGLGGADVGAFTATINWPAIFNWTNRAAITAVNRSANLTINWTGGDPQGTVQIFGFSGIPVGSDNAIGAAFVCLEAASRGTFTVPAAILRALPASGSIGGVSLGQIAVYGMSRMGSFAALGIDFGRTLYLAGNAKTLGYN
jgi:uncharacterized protein (TIGR03437 family)